MDNDLDKPTWDKLVRDSEKAGYREGVAAGRESVFQNSFNIGYAGGFENAFHIAKLKGALKANKLDFKFEDSELENTRRGNCLVCNNEELKQKVINDVNKEQHAHSNEIYKKLCLKHENSIVISLSN